MKWLLNDDDIIYPQPPVPIPKLRCWFLSIGPVDRSSRSNDEIFSSELSIRKGGLLRIGSDANAVGRHIDEQIRQKLEPDVNRYLLQRRWWWWTIQFALMSASNSFKSNAKIYSSWFPLTVSIPGTINGVRQLRQMRNEGGAAIRHYNYSPSHFNVITLLY